MVVRVGEEVGEGVLKMYRRIPKVARSLHWVLAALGIATFGWSLLTGRATFGILRYVPGGLHTDFHGATVILQGFSLITFLVLATKFQDDIAVK